jgi:hypothetical protein
MANRSGNVYGLTTLSPILDDPAAEVSHAVALRTYLGKLARDEKSPFAKIDATHMARLVVMDDVVFVGYPAHEEHLKSKYLVFEANFDGDLDTYLRRMANETRDEVEAIWGHCTGYPGLNDAANFVTYMKSCQLTTTFYFADVNDKTVEETLRALEIQSGLATFIERNSEMSPAELQAAFAEFWKSVQVSPPPLPAAKAVGVLPCFLSGKNSVKGKGIS